MLVVEVPGRGPLEIEHLVLDVNGTIALDGSLIEGVAEALAQLTPQMKVVAVTADMHGTASALAVSPGIDVHVIDAGDEARSKTVYIEELGPERVAAIGNGSNDEGMLGAAALGICVIGREGAATEAHAEADIIVTSILDALGLLVEPQRLIATLRR